MSAISLKSITGITSITTPAGADNQFTLHTNNTSQALKLDQAGNIHIHNHLNTTGVSTASNFKTGSTNVHSTGVELANINTGGGTATFGGDVSIADKIVHTGDTNTKIRFPAADTISFETAGSERLRVGSSGQLGIAGANYGSSGQVLTSGGSGSAVSWSTISGTTINNNANNRIITGSGTANTLEGEANLTFDGTEISVGTGATISSVGNLTAGIGTFVGGATIFGGGSSNIDIYNQGGTHLWTVKASGNIEPGFNNFFSIGDTGKQVNNVYTKNLYLGDDIIHNGDTNTKIRFPAADTISFETDGNERLRIFSSGNLGVGDYSSTSLTHAIQALRTSGTTVVSAKNTNGNATFYAEASNGNTARLEIFQAGTSGYSLRTGSTDALQFFRDSTYLAQFDNNGRLLLGTTTEGHASADDLTINNSGHGGITIRTGTTSNGAIFFSDATSGADEYDGFVQYNHGTDPYMLFGTAGSTRLRITSTGLLLGGSDASNNTTLGGNAGDSIASGGTSNTLIGKDAGTAISTGDSHVALGYLALKTISTNSGCVAVGSNALEVCTGADNCAVGFAAGQQVAGGTNNCLIGSSAGLQIQEGDHNIAIGRDALRMGSNGAVNYNVVVGSNSLNQLTNAYNNVVIGYNCSGSGTMTGGSTWHSNVVIGYQAGNIKPTTASNIVIGKYTCRDAGTTHSDNIVMGTDAGRYLGNSSNNCVILGQEAAYKAGYGSGSNHAYSYNHSVAIGYRAYYNATGGPDAAVAIGSNCLKEHKGDGDGSSGGYIAAVGNSALMECEHMRHTVALGNDAGAYWNPGKGHQHEGGGVFVGGGAGRYGGTAPSLIAIGRNAGNASSANPMSGPHNLLIGSRSGEKIRDGENNTCIGGNYCALFLQTGDWNTILGSLAGYGYDTTNAIQSGSYCTQIGAYSKSSGASNNYENCFGYGITGKGANTTHIRGSAYNSNNSSSWSTTSDERIKKNIVDNNTGLDAIEKIRVRNFEYRTKNEITDFDNPDAVVVEKEGLQLGVIAQEIKDILPDVVKQNTTGAYAVDPDNLTWYLVNAVKELSAEVKSLKAQLNS